MTETNKKFTKKELTDFININFNSRNYFYSKADEKWLKWLWDNGFLDVLKQQPDYSSGYYDEDVDPEFRYLVRMSEVVPAQVTKILLEIPITQETFDPEIINCFAYICSRLPVKYLSKLIPKIKKEKWGQLLHKWEETYGDKFPFYSSQKYENLLLLLESVLNIQPDD